MRSCASLPIRLRPRLPPRPPEPLQAWVPHPIPLHLSANRDGIGQGKAAGKPNRRGDNPYAPAAIRRLHWRAALGGPCAERTPRAPQLPFCGGPRLLGRPFPNGIPSLAAMHRPSARGPGRGTRRGDIRSAYPNPESVPLPPSAAYPAARYPRDLLTRSELQLYPSMQ